MPKPVQIDSLSNYIQYLEDECEEYLVLFRGQPTDEPLLPKIARIGDEVKEKISPEDILQIEKRMLEDFEKYSFPYRDIKSENSWDLMALAQHHRMATRLLDWTLNPLAALWFTVSEPPKEEKGIKKDGVVWVFKPEESDIVSSDEQKTTKPTDVTKTKVFKPSHITRRIIVQSGWFTVHKYLDEKKQFIPLEQQSYYKKSLTKLIIPFDKFGELRIQLNRCGINNATLFPDLDGLCNHIVWSNSLLADEIAANKGLLTIAIYRRRHRKALPKKKN